jgi:hypothetical protein
MKWKNKFKKYWWQKDDWYKCQPRKELEGPDTIIFSLDDDILADYNGGRGKYKLAGEDADQFMINPWNGKLEFTGDTPTDPNDNMYEIEIIRGHDSIDVDLWIATGA